MVKGPSESAVSALECLLGYPGHPRGRPGPRRDLRGRDRRHQSIRRARPAGLLGRAHPTTPRVRHPCAAGPHHQARVPAGALGRRRGRRPPTRRHARRHLEPSRCRPPRQIHRPGRRRTQAPQHRLLRPARRRDPLPGQGGVRPGRRSQHASSHAVLTPAITAAWSPT